ncbi:uncharacterized protein METZ01_LOCUS31600 [marine metagenome]|uniref:Uncharacterized protein n=1 Tax=marine metagenome TaxID=408172 RepID=A0A381QHE4_9ZZZZ
MKIGKLHQIPKLSGKKSRKPGNFGNRSGGKTAEPATVVITVKALRQQKN